MAQQMTDAEWREFVTAGTRTGKLAVTRRDGRAHVTPVWFLLDGDDVVLTTHGSSVKARALRRDPRAALCVDDQQPPYSFVTIEGAVTLSEDPRGAAALGHRDRPPLHGPRAGRGVRRPQRRAR